ncbi:hypothetical protein ACPOL_4022 [Acidisarcina polymorpha]|uniref:Uncharacterized protein n=1 Tax=Acidisarcina polymorpha TaxID=2211140 RepID=A0A2Z5G2E8_9BACT|nr:hypothetical protein ACPOL_4022 [Acidisarcina polymorpha]
MFDISQTLAAMLTLGQVLARHGCTPIWQLLIREEKQLFVREVNSVILHGSPFRSPE